MTFLTLDSNIDWSTGLSGMFTDLWYVVVPPFSLLLLQFDGDSSDWTPLDPLHQMRHIPMAKHSSSWTNKSNELTAHLQKWSKGKVMIHTNV